MKKKFMAVVVSLCLLIGLVPTMAFAEDSKTIVVNSATELQKAIATDAFDGDTVKLGQDIEITPKDYKEYEIEQNITLDLGGKTLSMKGKFSVLCVRKQANAIIKNGKIEGSIQNQGKLALNDLTVVRGSEQSEKQRIAAVFNPVGDLTIGDNVIIKNDLTTSSSNDTGLTVWNGTVTINGKNTSVVSSATNSVLVDGGKLIVNNCNFPAGASYAVYLNNAKGSVEINGGKFESRVFYRNTGGNDAIHNPDIVVTGGTFSFNPTAYVNAENCTVSNTDKTYTVSAKKIIVDVDDEDVPKAPGIDSGDSSKSESESAASASVSVPETAVPKADGTKQSTVPKTDDANSNAMLAALAAVTAIAGTGFAVFDRKRRLCE